MLHQPAVAALVERLHKSSARCSIIMTGAGGMALGALLGVAGCSRTLIDAQIPYHTAVSRSILDHYPRALVSEKVGVELAQAAFTKGRKILECSGDAVDDVIGLGATAAIATDRSRRGADVAYISCWDRHGVTSYRLLLDKADDRQTQEQLVSRVVLAALADGARVSCEDLDLALPPVGQSEIPATASEAAGLEGSFYTRSFTPIRSDPFDSLIDGVVEKVVVNRNGCPRAEVQPYCTDEVDPTLANYLLYPGSFNPLHWGHTELARVASQVVTSRDPKRKPVILTYEVALSRVGKADLSASDLRSQVTQFAEGGHRVAFTTAKLFVEKARNFPHHGLVVGIDTIVRVLDPKYYGGSRDAMIRAIGEIRAHNCFFVVGGRIKDDQWIDLSHVDIPEELAEMFVPIPQHLFRVDISSTEIRQRRNSNGPEE